MKPVKLEYQTLASTILSALWLSIFATGAMARAEPFDLEFCSFFGGTPANGYEASGLCFDADANVFLTGSIFGSISNHPVTADAFDKTTAGDGEAFFAVFSPDLGTLRYSSNFGGAGSDRIRDLARTKTGDLIFAGDTYSTNLPVTAGALQENYAGQGDAYIARFKPRKLPPCL